MNRNKYQAPLAPPSQTTTDSESVEKTPTSSLLKPNKPRELVTTVTFPLPPTPQSITSSSSTSSSTLTLPSINPPAATNRTNGMSLPISLSPSPTNSVAGQIGGSFSSSFSSLLKANGSGREVRNVLNDARAFLDSENNGSALSGVSSQPRFTLDTPQINRNLYFYVFGCK